MPCPSSALAAKVAISAAHAAIMAAARASASAECASFMNSLPISIDAPIDIDLTVEPASPPGKGAAYKRRLEAMWADPEATDGLATWTGDVDEWTPPPSAKRARHARCTFADYWGKMGLCDGVLYRGCYGNFFNAKTSRCVVSLEDGVLLAADSVDGPLRPVKTEGTPSRHNKRNNSLRIPLPSCAYLRVTSDLA